jgi:predicted metal-dependent HD superfamily phosphohydrolase
MAEQLTKKAEFFARKYAQENIDASYLFHSISHFEQTVEAGEFLGVAYQLDKEALEELIIALWFHDLGFSGGWKDHEERSSMIARDFLLAENQPEDRIARIEKYIQATKKESEPATLIEQIMRDADTAHLGSKNYLDVLAKLRAEWETHESRKYSDRKWLKLNLDFIQQHKFYTTVAATKYQNRKHKNLSKIRKHLANQKKFEKTIRAKADSTEPTYSVKKSDRGVETMFRVTLRNHNNLSRIADNKANIMLSINAIMLSIIVSSLVPKIGANPNFLLPSIILISVCMASIIMATLSTRPKITSAKYSDEKFLDKRFNILFFGNFYQIPIDKFEWGIKNLMHDEELLYSSLSKDLYYLGLVLAKKYKYLNICYNVFMFGLLAAALSFIVAIAI